MSIAHHEAPAAPPTTASDGESHTISAPYESVPRQLLIKFTGSGSEYFRIWIVNLLLTLVTLGLYFPWAKVRRLRYFYANTLVDSDPLQFHGTPLQMFKGFVIVVAGFALYSVAGEFSRTAGFLAFLVVAALWPLLFRSSMCFRLSNTSWRGLRFAFAGSKSGAYLAWLPLFLPGIGFIVFFVFSQALSGPDTRNVSFWLYQLGSGFIALGSIGVIPWLLYRLKSYQHRNYCFSSETTGFTIRVSDYYRTALKCLGVVMLVSIGALVLGIPATVGLFVMGEKEGMQTNMVAMIFVGLLMLAFGVLLYSVANSYMATRFQNLVWNGTRSKNLQFTSALRVAPMMALSVKNGFLTLLSLGMYWPYAVVAMTRLRLESVQVECSVDPAQWMAASSSVSPGSAMGDASGDFFGFDVGL